MSYLKVYIHFVWSTKNRKPFLTTFDLRQKVWKHIKENASSKGIYVDKINGYEEHCHCLISLGKEHSLSHVMRLIKGESSFWINKHYLCKQKFEWQDAYYAASVSYSGLKKVREYISYQEVHHKKKTFQKEIDVFIEEHGFEKHEE